MRLYLNLIRDKMKKKQNQSYKMIENTEQKNKTNKRSYLSYFLCCFYFEDDTKTIISKTDSIINMQNSNNSTNIKDINEVIENIILYNQDNFIEQNIYNYEEETKEEPQLIQCEKSINTLDNQEVIDYSFEELKI